MPTFLSDEQIDYILASFPPVNAADNYAAVVARGELLKDLTRQLVEVEVSLSRAEPGTMPVEIHRIIDHITKRYRTALVRPGDPRGNEAADAFGAIIQKALDTFKTGDTAAVSGGIKSLQAALYAYRDRADARCIVHFIPRVTDRDVIDMKGIIVQSLVKDFFAKTPDIIPITQQGPPGIVVDLFQLEWWHKVYQGITGRIWGQTHRSSYCLRLYLDTVKMYERRVSMNDIRKAIKIDRQTADVICSPLRDGIIDIIPDDDQVVILLKVDYKVPIPDPVRVFLDLVVQKTLSTNRVKGIPGILDIESVQQKTVSLIVDPVRPTAREFATRKLIPDNVIDVEEYKKGLWRNDINTRISRTTGARIGDLVQLIVRAGITVIDIATNEFREVKTLYTYHSSGDRPADIINKMVKDNKDDDQIARWATYVYAVTTGSNLVELQKIPWIDKTRTSSNNTYQLCRLFGVEAARAYALWETLEIMRHAGMVVSPHHPLLLFDAMYGLGMPLGINFPGVTKQQGRDFIGLATTQKAADVFREAALYNSKAPTNTFSVSVVIGKVPPVGSGADEILNKQAYVNRIKEKIERRAELRKRGGPSWTAERIAPERVTRFAQSLREEGNDVDAVLRLGVEGSFPELGAGTPTRPTRKEGTRVLPVGNNVIPASLEEGESIAPFIIPQVTVDMLNDLATTVSPISALRLNPAPLLAAISEQAYDYPEPFAYEEKGTRVYEQLPPFVATIIG